MADDHDDDAALTDRERELKKWNAPYVPQEYPRMLYRCATDPAGHIEQERRFVQSAGEEQEAQAAGWLRKPDEAEAAEKARQEAIAAARQEQEQRKLGDLLHRVLDEREARRKKPGGIPPFPEPPQPPVPAPSMPVVTSWDEIEIWFLGLEAVQLTIRGKLGPRLNYAELGFEDQRNHRPTGAWGVLRELARAGGTLKNCNYPGRMKQHVVRIRKVLRAYLEQQGLSIPGDPLPYIKRAGYQAQFKIGLRPSFHI